MATHFLGPLIGDANCHQQSEVFIQENVAVRVVGFPVDILLVSKIMIRPVGMLILPLLLEARW